MPKDEDKQYQTTEIDEEMEKMKLIKTVRDPSLLIREANMRRLMSFRKDELVLPDESENDTDPDSESSIELEKAFVKRKMVNGV